MKIYLATLFTLATTALLPAAHAQRVLLDDSLSPQQNFAIELNWSAQAVDQAMSALFADQDVALPPLTGRLTGVDIRLNTSAFVGKQARIYLSVPAGIAGDNSGGTLQLAWQASGRFESGSTRPGQSVLIFEGPVDSPVLGGIFDFAISMGSAGAAEPFSFELQYELEVINP